MLDDQTTSAEERIVAAALTLIEERGLAAVTISAVARSAGVTRQTVYNHFEGIDAIVLAMLNRQDKMGSSHVGVLLDTAPTPIEKIELYVRHAIATQEMMGSADALRSSLGPESRRQLDQHRSVAAEVLTAIIADGVGDGSFQQDLDPVVAATLASGVLSAASGLTGSRSPSEVATRTTVAVLRMLGARPV